MFKYVLMVLLKVGGAFVGGLAVAAVLILGLMLVGSAFGQDKTVAVREAELGEQNKSFNYLSKGQTDVEVQFVIVENTSAADAVACDRTNRHTRAKLEYIASIIAEDPSKGEAYEGLIVLLHTMWCTDYD